MQRHAGSPKTKINKLVYAAVHHVRRRTNIRRRMYIRRRTDLAVKTHKHAHASKRTVLHACIMHTSQRSIHTITLHVHTMYHDMHSLFYERMLVHPHKKTDKCTPTHPQLLAQKKPKHLKRVLELCMDCM